MNSMYGGEAVPVITEQPGRIKKYADKALQKLKEYKVEIAVGTGLAVGSLALIAGAIKLSRDQDAGIQRDLTADSQTIPGFEKVSVDGTMWNYNPGSLHGATVTLGSGKECSIQFTTVDSEKWWDLSGPKHTKIVSYGTCPVPADQN